MRVELLDANRAALLHKTGTIGALARPPRSARTLWSERPAWPDAASPTNTMIRTQPREVFIQGLTPDGRTFRPSDWAERLAGAMSSFRPEGMRGGIGAYIGYSPLCVPRLINGIKCVIVNEELKEIEPMAWDFVMNFARDNQLRATESAPDAPDRPAKG